MAHKDWCGKPCSECSAPCRLDQEIPCSPDCDGLNEDGSQNARLCIESGCDAFTRKCPVCENSDLSFSNSCLQEESDIQKWSCNKCGASGNAINNFTIVTHLPI